MENIHLKPEELFLIQSVLLIGLPYLLWRIGAVKKFVPIVVIQILLGIILGPSVLGRILPDFFGLLFPPASIPMLSGLSLMAIVLFGFLTGLHFDAAEIKGKGKSFTLVSLSSIIIPAILGGLVGWLISGNQAFIGENATKFTFILGTAIAIGVTALPVLSATLIDMKLIDKPFGRLALGYATVNDGILWILLAMLLSLTAAGAHDGGFGKVAFTILAFTAYLLIMIFAVRPLLQKLADNNKFASDPRHWELIGILCLVFLSALATEAIGVHYLLGAFIFGAVMPKSAAHDIMYKIDPVMSVILLPFFFMLTGLKTNFDILNSAIWALFAVVLAASSIGKFAGTALPEKYIAKSSWKKSCQLGGFMQCKGLMEVIILNMLLQGGIITSLSFSAMILMAVATTAITKPAVLLMNKIIREPAVVT